MASIDGIAELIRPDGSLTDKGLSLNRGSQEWVRAVFQEGISRLPVPAVPAVPGFRSDESERNRTETPALLTTAELLKAGEEDPDWFLDGMLPGDGLSLLCGDPKCGKSTISRCLALASARGMEFLGRLPVKAPSVMVSLEDSARKAGAHLSQMGAAGDDPLFWATYRALPDLAADRETALRVWIERHGAALAVIDSMQDFCGMRDLNDYPEVSRTLARYLAIARDTECHVMLVHHSSKAGGEDGKAALGSQALFGKPDTILTLRRDEDGLRYLSTRQREGDDLEPINVKLEPDGWVVPGQTRAEQAAAETEDEILAVIGPDWVARAGLPRAAGISKQRGLAAIDRLIFRGIVEQRGDGTRSKPKECRTL